MLGILLDGTEGSAIVDKPRLRAPLSALPLAPTTLWWDVEISKTWAAIGSSCVAIYYTSQSHENGLQH